MSDELPGVSPVSDDPTEPPVEKAQSDVVAAKTGPGPGQGEVNHGGDEKPAKVRTSDDDYDDLIKKSPLKYKAGGKEKSINSAADLKRLLSSRESTEAAISEALKEKNEAAGIKQKLAAIGKLRPSERLNALQSIGIDPQLLQEAVEESILAEDEKRKSQEGMSQREREMAAALERQSSELRTYRQQQEEAKRQQEEDAQVARINEVGERLNKTTLGALQKAKIPGHQAPQFIEAIAKRLDRNERLGLGMDEDEIAEVVLTEQGDMADQFYGAIEVPAMADRLEAMAVADPLDPSKQTTRAKLLMREFARRLRSQVEQPAQTFQGSRPAQQTQNGRELTAAEKMDRARTFGGGSY